MRFNNVEVERAYSDYLDSLEDWPPAEQAISGEADAAPQRPPDLNVFKLRKHPPKLLDS